MKVKHNGIIRKFSSRTALQNKTCSSHHLKYESSVYEFHRKHILTQHDKETNPTDGALYINLVRNEKKCIQILNIYLHIVFCAITLTEFSETQLFLQNSLHPAKIQISLRMTSLHRTLYR